MSAHNRVIWSEGLFLQPQHFQQQDRYFERYVETRCQALVPHSWGFAEIEFEQDFLKIGKLAFRRLAGVFPDGTPFSMPGDDPLPEPLEIDADVRDERVHLAIPLRRAGELEAVRGESADELVRQDIREVQASNAVAGGGEAATLEVAALRTRLLIDSEVSDAYACIPLTRVVECRADRQVVLDDTFIPTVLTVRTAARLATTLAELVGIFHQRGEALGGRAAATGRGAAAELGDFLMLQAINRYEPVLTHLASSGAVHPEELFRLCVSITGEFATFVANSKRTPAFPIYRHERLKESFEPVIRILREYMGQAIVPTAVPIPLEQRRFGISLAVVQDRSLFKTHVFVLAARTDGPSENVRQRFPSQVRIGPPEKIGDLVRQGLAGVPIVPVPVAPRQIPFHAGYAYFELDQSHVLWQEVAVAGAAAIHVGGEFPGLTMEFWAIRG
jgi:type VI secretion system protein ImpJ